MQTQDIISVNVWQIVISLLNLTILTLILKKFLFDRVRKVVDERKQAIDASYEKAAETNRAAPARRSSARMKPAHCGSPYIVPISIISPIP